MTPRRFSQRAFARVRAARGLTFEDIETALAATLGEEDGPKLSTIQTWEKHLRRRPKRVYWTALALAMGCSVEEITEPTTARARRASR